MLTKYQIREGAKKSDLLFIGGPADGQTRMTPNYLTHVYVFDQIINHFVIYRRQGNAMVKTGV